MSAEKSYVVMKNDWSQREYPLHELVWLWQTAQLPHDAMYRGASGEWRPIEELVQSVIEREARSPTPVSRPEPARRRWSARWLWAAGFIVVAMLGAWPLLRDRIAARKVAQADEELTMAHDRVEDLVSNNQVVPGMTREQVRRSVGEPRAIKASADASVERWTYRKQIVVFGNGHVTAVEPPPLPSEKR